MVSNIVAGVLGVVLGGASAEPHYNFLVLGGGFEREHNEIALEKNVLYFQRTLGVFGVDPATATLYFANGNDGKKTVRYLDEDGGAVQGPRDAPSAGRLHSRELPGLAEPARSSRSPHGLLSSTSPAHGALNFEDPE